MQIFVDMDGVLADFDAGYAALSAPHGGKGADGVDWALVRRTPGFFAALDPMPDYRELWAALGPHDPIILTGVPPEVPEALGDKRAWAARHIGPRARVIGCPARDKRLHGRPGDLLIDDWEKYRHLWIGMGGRWITHVSAAESIRLLNEYL